MSDGFDGPAAPRGRRMRRLGFVFGFVLATVAVAALVVGALALRDSADEQHTQARCAQTVAYSSVLIAARTGNAGFPALSKGVRTELATLLSACDP